MLKTTKKQFEIFKKECEYWVKEFGMLGWRFYFSHESLTDCYACCFWPDKSEYRNFTITFNKDLNERDKDIFTTNFIKKVAFHEVMEAFLFRISYIGECRYIQPEEINEERHHLIRTLEKVVFGGRKK